MPGCRFRDLVDRKIEMTEADLLAIVTDEISTAQDVYVLEDLQVRGGIHIHPSAKVRVRFGDKVTEESAEGDGMIDAACGAIQRAVGVNARLTSFKVGAVTPGHRCGRQRLGSGGRRRRRLLRTGRIDRRGRGVGTGLPQRGQPGHRRQRRRKARAESF